MTAAQPLCLRRGRRDHGRAGLLPKMAALVESVPQFVLGGAGLVMFGMVAATASASSRVDFKTNRNNLYVVAVSIGIGMIPLVAPTWSQDAAGDPLAPGVGHPTPALSAVLLNLYFNGGRGARRGRLPGGEAGRGRTGLADSRFSATACLLALRRSRGGRHRAARRGSGRCRPPRRARCSTRRGSMSVSMGSARGYRRGAASRPWCWPCSMNIHFGFNDLDVAGDLPDARLDDRVEEQRVGPTALAQFPARVAVTATPGSASSDMRPPRIGDVSKSRPFCAISFLSSTSADAGRTAPAWASWPSPGRRCSARSAW